MGRRTRRACRGCSSFASRVRARPGRLPGARFVDCVICDDCRLPGGRSGRRSRFRPVFSSGFHGGRPGTTARPDEIFGRAGQVDGRFVRARHLSARAGHLLPQVLPDVRMKIYASVSMLGAMFVAASAALAHPVREHAARHPQNWSELPSTWEFDPGVIIPLVLSLVLYGTGVFRLWRTAGAGHGITYVQAASFVAGWLTVV